MYKRFLHIYAIFFNRIDELRVSKQICFTQTREIITKPCLCETFCIKTKRFVSHKGEILSIFRGMERQNLIADLLNKKKILNKQLNDLVWGSIEVRERDGKSYIYTHKRDGGIPRSQFIGNYSEALFNQITKNNIEARGLKRKIRELDKELKKMDYEEGELSASIKKNIDLAKRNMVDSIYKQAKLEGMAVTFLDTETVVEGGQISNLSANDVQKINNLKHAWQFILDEGVATSSSDYNILCYINKLVEEGFYYSAGELRDVPVSIGGTAWKPEIPIEGIVRNELQEILAIENVYERAIKAQLYISRGQLFIDGNKRTATLFANHILISNGYGIIVVPEEMVPEYRKLLIAFYETNETADVFKFLFDNCLVKLK